MILNQLSFLGSAVGNHLWQSTAFAFVVWLMTLALRQNRARMRYGLWTAASLKFLLPFSLLLGIGNLIPDARKISIRNDQPAFSVVTTVMHPLRSPNSFLREDKPGTPSEFEPLYAVVGAWLVGTLCVLSTWAIRWRRVRRALDESVPLREGREYAAFRDLGGDIPLHSSRTVRQPGVYGILRPVLMWPEGLSNSLDGEHLTAIMMHELAHVRHRDNLIAALHMVVEAVFWFHPVVWWMEGVILVERENVCDESVVHQFGSAEVYASGLLKVSRFCVEPQLRFVTGVSGADLRNRIVNIVTHRAAQLSPVRALMLLLFGLATFAIPITLGIVHPLPVYGQVLYREEPLPSFEVVSVKLMPNGPPPTPPLQGGSTVHIYFTTEMLIGYAYNLPDFSEDQITKGPGWTDATYDVQGKISDADFAAMQKMSPADKQEQIQLRLQSLLKDRFNLKVHLEKREQTIFVLEVAKGGSKISAANDQVPERFDITHRGMDYDLKATRTDMDQLARLLGRQPEVGAAASSIKLD
jgi:bla regulator protein BlaR1